MNKNKIIYLLLFVLFVVCLFVSTPVITYFYNNMNGNDFKAVKNVELYKKDKVVYNIANISVNNDIFKTVDISGYSFVGNELNNDNKKIYLYLLSDKNNYRVTCDIFVDHSWVHMRNKGHKIKDGRIGFSTQFSALNLADGQYKVYIENIENETHYGMVYTKHTINVAGNNIEIVEDAKK